MKKIRGESIQDTLDRVQTSLNSVSDSLDEWSGTPKSAAGCLYMMLDSAYFILLVERLVAKVRQMVDSEDSGLKSGSGLTTWNQETDRLDRECTNLDQALARTINEAYTDGYLGGAASTLQEDLLPFVEDQLKEIVALSENRELYDDERWTSDEMHTVAGDFLYWCDQIDSLMQKLKAVEPDARLVRSFSEMARRLDDDFRRSFYHFTPVSDLLSHLQETVAAGPSMWWYHETPDPFKRDLFLYYESFATLAAEKKRQLVEHIANCDDCWHEWRDVTRLAASLARHKAELNKVEDERPGKILFLKQHLAKTSPALTADIPLRKAASGDEEERDRRVVAHHAIVVFPDKDGKAVILMPSEKYNDDTEAPLRKLSAHLDGNSWWYCVADIKPVGQTVAEVTVFERGNKRRLPLVIDCPEHLREICVIIALKEHYIDGYLQSLRQDTDVVDHEIALKIVQIFVEIERRDG